MAEFLPGVPSERILATLAKAGGNEVESGKFENPESSAALAVNTFGWFLERPEMLPPVPTLAELDWPAVKVDVEQEMRFPWSGGRHPWLDAVIETKTHLIGVESKRFEPFRDKKTATFAATYSRDVWGTDMSQYEAVRDALSSGLTYKHLDAVQLVKHAFGLVTQARIGGKKPVLLYLFAEPVMRGSRPIATDAVAKHREEIRDFADRVSGAEVRFAAASYREWLGTFEGEVRNHADAVIEKFQP